MVDEMTIVPDEGFYFGLGAFETIAVEHGRPLFLAAHMARLGRALEFLGIERGLDEALRCVKQKLSSSRGLIDRTALKVVVTPENTLASMRPNPYTAHDYARGFDVVTSTVRRNETSPLTAHKTLNYGDCILERRRARAAGKDEALFLNMAGNVAECASSNVFFVCGEELVTPSLDSGLLPGIVREVVCECFDVTERPVARDELEGFDEMFLTNSLMGVMPARSLDGRPFASRRMARRVEDALKREAGLS